MGEEALDIGLLKERGLSCGKLKSMWKREFADAKKFRESGFSGISQTEEQIAQKIKQLHNKVCLLK